MDDRDKTQHRGWKALKYFRFQKNCYFCKRAVTQQY